MVVVLEAGKTPDPVQFELPLLGEIAGTLVDKAGDPIEGFNVRLLAEPRSPVRTQYARTDASGRFHFREVVDQEWNLQAGATKYGVVRIGQTDLVVTTVRPDPNAKLPG